MFETAPNGAGRFLFLLIQTLPTFSAERILILICCRGILLDSKFLDFQVPRFTENLAWARLGPGLGQR